MNKEAFVDADAHLSQITLSDFSLRVEQVFHVCSPGPETRLNYELASCGSSSVSRQSGTITHTSKYLHQTGHLVSRCRFLFVQFLCQVIFFFHSGLWSFQASDFPLGDARPMLKEL